LFAQCLIFLGFSCDSCDFFGGHIKNSDGRKDARQRGYEFSLNNFICYIIDKSF
jgi:hypothetical protein